jgi:hypothetical protein
LKAEEFDAYVSLKNTISRATETQLFTPGYYEHVVRFEGDVRRRMVRRDNPSVSLANQDNSVHVELGEISNLFCICLADADVIDRNLRRLAVMTFGRDNDPQPLNAFFRLSSIKVKCDVSSNFGRNQAKLHELAESVVFHVAYGQGTSISFTQSWARTYYWVGRKEKEEIQFPRRSYISELVGYYNLALASDSLVLSYLALYNILEYFYTSVSESELHKKLVEQLVTPDFSHTKTKKLRELVKTVRKFDTKTDELSALRLVLAEFVGPADLKTWIDAYEGQNSKHFTIPNDIFGSVQSIDTISTAIVSNVAKRIYVIRNALVHNKEGETSRFVPYTGQEGLLQTEVQLILYIAEQLVVKTGKDLTF